MNFREYNTGKDREAALRIWTEVGWIESDRKDDQNKVFEKFVTCGNAYVADIRGESECLVLTMPGKIKYLNKDISLCGVTGVTTSRIARKQNIATRLTAHALRKAADEGFTVAGLGIFDQGFYNKLGFGSSSYENIVTFDPGLLRVRSPRNVPYRIGKEEFEKVHLSRLSRLRGHGSVNILPVDFTRFEMNEIKNSFGLGYYDKSDNQITHHIWMSSKDEHGPYEVHWMSYKSYTQLMELFSVIKSLDDQVFQIKIKEPPEIQLQDLLDRPFRNQEITSQGKYQNYVMAQSYQQYRILDITESVKAVTLNIDMPAFNLELYDPVEEYLSESTSWKGLTGKYIIKFGKESFAEPGNNPKIMTMKANIAAFTRLWLGVRNASSLSATNNLKAQDDLLKAFDENFRLPAPKPDWIY